MDPNFVKHSEERMKKAVETIRHEVASIRTSKATTSLLDSIRVEYYGNPVPLQQVASVSAPEARLLVVQPWERNIVPEVV
ncbi:MAG TPA: ribosome recycling factor, partial [Candidatus Nitrosocosmicus sp.]|nr:ribosome recycling factor [Candidatus Nitrosocosmicus sp.]